MANITSYDAKDCTVLVDNVFITGLGEDMISGEKDEDNVSPVVGAQGDIVANKKNNSLGTITLTVQGTSPQRKHLDSLANSGKIFPIWVANKSLDEKMGGTQAMMKKPASREYGAELADREYEIQVFDYTVE